MRTLNTLLAATLTTFVANTAVAQITFGPLEAPVDIRNELGYTTNGSAPEVLLETLDGFRISRNFSLERNVNFDPPVAQGSIFDGRLLRFAAFRQFAVGQLPVEVDLTATEDMRFALANGHDANPVFEVATRASIVMNQGSSQVPLVVAEGVTAEESRMAGSGTYLVDRAIEIKDYVLAPNTNYLLLYEADVFVRHDALVDDFAAQFIVQSGGITSHDGVEVSLHSTVLSPEPSSMVMAACGIATLFGYARHRRRRTPRSWKRTRGGSPISSP